MGLMLSILVVCVGVLEAISCVHHFQNGYLPFWMPNRMRPMINEHLRRKPNDDDGDSSDSSDELSRILHNGGGVKLDRAESPSYGLTPILTEHRRNTPILRDEADDDDDPSIHPKYVENNIDDSCSANIHGCLLTETFRPISPPDPEEALDGSFVSSSGKFLETPGDDSTPQRSSSEETLHDSEPDDERIRILSLHDLARAACPIDAPKRFENVEAKAADNVPNLSLDGVVFQIDRASPPILQCVDVDLQSQPRQGLAEHDIVPGLQIPFVSEDLEDDDDDEYNDDPIYNLLAASANILQNDANKFADAPYIPRVSPQNIVTQSSCRPLSIDTTARIPTPQSHRESMPFDLIAAHDGISQSSSRPLSIDVTGSIPTIQTHRESLPFDYVANQEELQSSGRPLSIDTSLGIPTPQAHRPSMPFDWTANQEVSQLSSQPLSIDSSLGIPTPQAHRPSMPFDWTANQETASSSRPATPSTPMKSKADISWPVFHPEPVIKRPLLALSDLNRGDSIEEDFDPSEGTDGTGSYSLGHIEDIPQVPRSPVSILKSSHSRPKTPTPSPKEVTDIMFLSSTKPPPISIPANIWPSDSNTTKDILTKPTSLENDVIGVEDECSKVAIRSLSTVPSTPFMTVSGKSSLVSHKSHVEDHTCPTYHTSVDKFGRITCQPHKGDRQRRKSLEHVEVGNLKDSVLSKSLPDFFFEENVAKLQSASSASNLKDGRRKEENDSSESVSVGKDITPKESSIKRRKSYREKKRHTSSSSKSPDHIPVTTLSKSQPEKESQQSSEAITENENEIFEDSKRRESIDKVESKTEAILNKELVPEEVLHHGDVKPESAVFATKSQQAKTRLKKPARAESFEEAPVTAQPLQTTATPPVRQKDDHVKDTATKPTKNKKKTSNENVPVKVPSDPDRVHHSPRTIEQPPPLPATLSQHTTDKTRVSERPDEATSQSNETKPNSDDNEGEEEEEDIEYIIDDESDTSNANQPQQSSQAPFWLIFSGEYTKAMSKDWHSGHFCCWQCDESLTGQRYVLRDDHPYCIKCYESVFANMCEECSKTIGIDSKDLSYKDKHWHEACFLCNKCRVSLVDKQFGSKADKIYCGNCYDAQFASRCDGCGEIFRAGTKKMEYKTRQWHEKCFCCCVCKSAIGTKSFIPREQEIYCATCYEEKFATRCVKCNKIITSGGVTYKNEPWHRECFTCTNCNTSLAGQRFTSRDEKPYCADCFGELFAKRCTACVKPITGIGGTRFISFEDRHWHNDCFICASCKTSLVGRGFITDAEDIICPECAKQKLM